MGSEIEADYTTGKTLYAQIRNSTGSIFNIAGAFEAYQTANIGQYAVNMSEQGVASGFYTGSIPGAVNASGTYNIIVKDRAGGSPAESDRTIAVGQIEWDGSAVQSLYGIVSVIFANVIEGAVTFLQACRLWNSAMGGKASGLAGTNALYRDLGDTKNRIDATVDANGNRTVVTLNLT